MFKKNRIVSDETRRKIGLGHKGRRKGNSIKTDETTATIKLNYGHFAVIDKEDLPLVSGYTWRWSRGYAVTQITREDGSHRTQSMHRMIIGNPPVGQVCDHKDRNKLNNRRSNLHHVSFAENRWNNECKNPTGTKGIYYRPVLKTWMARLYRDGKYVLNKSFPTVQEAINARLVAENLYIKDNEL